MDAARIVVGFSPASAAELMETHSMRLTLGHLGDWIVDPRELAARLNVNEEDLKRMERYGYVKAWIKADGGEKTGCTRVTVRLLSRGWCGIFDQSGVIIGEEFW